MECWAVTYQIHQCDVRRRRYSRRRGGSGHTREAMNRGLEAGCDAIRGRDEPGRGGCPSGWSHSGASVALSNPRYATYVY